ncbi:MAG: histidine--tRNA ligase [Candidatus Magasanikbacteria bacterium]
MSDGEFSTQKGMEDILPKDEKYWRKMYELAQDLADTYEFGRIETPVLEDKSLFVRSVGEDSDIVNKEMYEFEDKGENEVVLKPENTASIARSYIENGMRVDPKPVKLWYWDQFYRYEQPQKGRYRRFHQFGCESLGTKLPIVEAELINICYTFFSELGLDVQVNINSIGSPEDRENYLVELKGYLNSKKSYLSDKSKKKLEENPLRVLDSKKEEDQPILEEAPQIIDWISEDSKQYLMTVIEYMDEMEIPYELDSTLVRGLDYYTDTVFEIFERGEEVKKKNSLGGGGRYDNLITELGGKEETPAAGFSIGLERVVTAMRRKEQETDDYEVEEVNRHDIFFAQLGEDARRQALQILEELRSAGIKVHNNLAKEALRDQLEIADDLDVPYSLILGQKEAGNEEIIIRDMESGNQETVDQDDIVEEVRDLID